MTNSQAIRELKNRVRISKTDDRCLGIPAWYREKEIEIFECAITALENMEAIKALKGVCYPTYGECGGKQ